MTEDEAKTKWCPFTYAVPEFRDPATGQGFREGGPWPCCTTHCMAWQVGTPKYLVTFDGEPEEEWSWDPSQSEPDKHRSTVHYVPTGKCRLLTSQERQT